MSGYEGGAEVHHVRSFDKQAAIAELINYIHSDFMQPSPNIHSELCRCSELLEKLASTKSPDEFDDVWQRFLGHLERVWNKWNGWKGRFEKHRRSDPLLIYLTNARGAHEHTVADITSKKPNSIGIGAGPSGSVHIKQLIIEPNNLLRGEWDGDLAVTFIPGQVDPVAVTNRGKIYEVPTSHMGSPLPDTTALTLAKNGLAYYECLVKDAERFFAKFPE